MSHEMFFLTVRRSIDDDTYQWEYVGAFASDAEARAAMEATGSQDLATLWRGEDRAGAELTRHANYLYQGTWNRGSGYSWSEGRQWVINKVKKRQQHYEKVWNHGVHPGDSSQWFSGEPTRCSWEKP